MQKVMDLVCFLCLPADVGSGMTCKLPLEVVDFVDFQVILSYLIEFLF